MQQQQYSFAKINSIQGEEFFINQLPSFFLSRQRQKQSLFKEISQNVPQPEMIQIMKCKNIEIQELLVLSYDYKMQSYFIAPFRNIVIDHQKTKNILNINEYKYNCDPFLQGDEYKYKKYYVQNLSQIHIQCNDCEFPHIFFLTFPNQQVSTVTKQSIFIPQKNSQQENIKQKVPDLNLQKSWRFDDRDQLKRHLLTYGYGRWEKIQAASKSMGGKLNEKSKNEIRIFSNVFLRTMADNLTCESQELKNFLYNIIQELPEDPYILSNVDDWDPQKTMRAKAIIWGKRLQLMHRVEVLIKYYIQNQKQDTKSEQDINWSKMLNFLSTTNLMGQKPCLWWTRKHDVDLIRGTYEYGYANYHEMRPSHKLCFHEIEKLSDFQEFPQADTVTRRIKKLISCIMKSEQENKLDFDVPYENDDEQTEWTKDEKFYFFNYLTNYGLPINLQDGKTNYNILKEKQNLFLPKSSNEKSAADFEKFVHSLRMKCLQIVDNKEVNQTDEDGFTISFQDAETFNKNLNMFSLIGRKILLPINYDKSVLDLQKIQTEESHPAYMGKDYNYENDLLLFKCILEYGLKCQHILKEHLEYKLQFQKFNFDQEKIKNRAAYVCQQFKNNQDKNKTVLKKGKSEKSINDFLKKKPRFQIERDQDGNIKYPLQINNSIKLLNIGYINTNQAYHSEHNLFPVGFKTTRIYSSMKFKGEKCEYTSEILEGPDGRPQYSLQSEEDPEHPIIRDSSTGCWVYVCQKVNELSDHKKEKVTISGTERFGLLEPNIVKLLEELPNAEKCFKYTFKYKNQTQEKPAKN